LFVLWYGGGVGDDDGGGEVAGGGEADVEVGETEGLGAAGGAVVKEKEWLAAAVGEHLDVAPADAADAGAERLHGGLLGGEAGRQLRDAAATEGDLRRRVDAGEEPLRMALEDARDAVQLYDVDADCVV
jgi:hypothetical protein